MSFLELRSLEAKYNEIYVLKNLNLSIEKGEFVSVVGKYGSGKSTLLKIIAGLTPIHKGSVLVNGLTPSEAIKKRIIGLKFQKSNLLPWRNVIENLLLPLELAGIDDNEKAYQLLHLAELTSISEHHISQLSGGMEQLISILRSLVLDPELLLLDEPFSSLDEITREDLYEKIKLIHIKEKITILMVTHSITEALQLSDKIAVLGGKPAKIIKVFNNKNNKTNIDEIKKCLIN